MAQNIFCLSIEYYFHISFSDIYDILRKILLNRKMKIIEKNVIIPLDILRIKHCVQCTCKAFWKIMYKVSY